jgi:hypothetical protein
VIGVAMLLVAIAVGWMVGPKWWHLGWFIVLTLVLFVPSMMAFFIPLPIVIILNVAMSHAGWLKEQGALDATGIPASH